MVSHEFATVVRAALATDGIMKVADTVASLRELSVAGASSSWTAILQGCLAASDGGGGVFFWDSASTLADDTGLTVKPNAIAGPGRWRRIYSGPVNVKWFGAKGDRSDPATDDTSPINAAIAASRWVFLPAGTYYVTSLLTGNQNTLRLTGTSGSQYGADPRTVIAPFSKSSGPLVQISDGAVNGPPLSVQLENITIDGAHATGGHVDTGVLILKGQDIRLKHVFVTNCATGIYIAGTSNSLQTRVMNVFLDSCLTWNNAAFGCRIEPPVTQGAFSNFTLLNCSSESDEVGCRISNASLVSIQSSEFQNFKSYGLDIAASNVSLISTWLEGQPGSTTLNVTNSGRVLALSSNIYHPAIDCSSVVESHNCTVAIESSTTSRLGLLFEPSSTSWGPPNLGTAGAIYPRGYSYTDMQGVEWVCVVPGTSGNSAFIARSGRIMITVDAAQLLNGNMLWYPQCDFLVERISFVVTQTLIGNATDLSFATMLNGNSDDLIRVPITNGQVASGTVITAAETQPPTRNSQVARRSRCLGRSLPM